MIYFTMVLLLLGFSNSVMIVEWAIYVFNCHSKDHKLHERYEYSCISMIGGYLMIIKPNELFGFLPTTYTYIVMFIQTESVLIYFS